MRGHCLAVFAAAMLFLTTPCGAVTCSSYTSCATCMYYPSSCSWCFSTMTCVSGTPFYGPTNYACAQWTNTPSYGCNCYSTARMCSSCLSTGYCGMCSGTCIYGNSVGPREIACASSWYFSNTTCAVAQVPCTNYSSCSQCTAVAGCGWCDSSKTCLPGDSSLGPIGKIACTNWVGYGTAGCSCVANNNNCSGCVALSYCVYCDNVCKLGSTYGPSGTFACSGGFNSYYYGTCATPFDYCLNLNSSCYNCLGNGVVTCAYCASTGLCVRNTTAASSFCPTGSVTSYYNNCPTTCGLYGTCGGCSSVYGCGWCGSSQSCVVGLYSGANGTCAQWFKASCSVVTIPCSNYTTCTTCSSASDCGWCAATSTCMQGTYSGPYNSLVSCPTWVPYSSGCSCTLLNANCSVCLSGYSCVYCGDGNCMYGSSSGPYYGQCRSTVGYYYSTCALPYDSCRSYNSSCSTCLSYSGCVYCAATGTCTQGSSIGPKYGTCGNMYSSYSSCPYSNNCSAYGTCAGCLTVSSYCGWCGSSSSCVSLFSLGTQCAQPYLTSCTTQMTPCSNYTTCSSCTLFGPIFCAWCATTSKCMNGNSTGPHSGTCNSNWVPYSTGCTCAAQTSCQNCTAYSYCIYSSTSECVYGYSSGPYYGNWPASTLYYYQSCAQYYDTCLAYNSSCSNCLRYSGCVYCATSGLCTKSYNAQLKCQSTNVSTSSSCPTLCSAFGTCGGCSSLYGCGWCATTSTCVSGNYSYPATGSCASWYYTGCATPTVPCSNFTGCYDCSYYSNNNCGWCATTGKCLDARGTCKNWIPYYYYCSSCAPYNTSCSTCVTQGCVYCDGDCMYGSTNGPYYGSCSSTGYYYSTCTAIVDRCASYNSSCSNCVSYSGCTYCLAAGTCTAYATSCGTAAANSTTSCPSSCSSYGTCGGCRATSGCGWCASTSTCVSGNYYSPTSGSCASWYYLSCTTASLPCSNFLNCASCLSSSSGYCGWCGTTSSCMSSQGTCKNWIPYSYGCTYCAPYNTSCSSCITRGYSCVYCDGDCMYGGSSGPYYGSCSSAGFYYSSCTAVMDRCASYSSSCSNCVSYSGCTYCLAAGTCTAYATSCGTAAANSTTSCPSSCSSYGTCGGCRATSGCGWCASTSTCVSGNYYSPTSGSCASWYYLSCTTATVPCSSITNCASCASTSGYCGWCGTTSSCVSSQGTCKNWIPYYYGCNYCAPYNTSCSSCITRGYSCVFCDGDCMYGGSSGPYYGSCSNGGYYYSSCSVITDRCASYNSSCTDCTYYNGCSFCPASGLCSSSNISCSAPIGISYSCPSSCSAFGTCGGCRTQEGCGWCDSSKACVQGTIGGPIDGTCLLWFYSSCYNSQGACTQQSSCSSCTATSGCGWCASTSSCIVGSSEGPDRALCDNWVPYSFGCSCAAASNTSCSACLSTSSNCVYCGTDCMYGYSSPSYGICRFPCYSSSYYSCRTPVDYCASYSSCGDCVSQIQCGFCASTGRCRLGSLAGASNASDCPVASDWFFNQCPLSCNAFASCDACLKANSIGLLSCQFCYVTQTCESYCPQSLSLSSCSASVGSQCSNRTSCSSCANGGGCGWCHSTRTCVLGTYSGPTLGSCPMWDYYGYSCTCSQYLNCSSCVSSYSCVFCDGSCVYGGSSGPYYYTCSSNMYYYSSCAAPYDNCARNSFNCYSCSWSRGCGYCAGTGLCSPGTLDGPASSSYCPTSSSSIVGPTVQWFYRSCPTDCSRYVSCSDCVNSGQPCVYCNSSLRCVSSTSAEAATCGNVGCSPPAPPPAMCSSYTTCSQCSSYSSRCTWCISTQQCIGGNSSGPLDPASCSVWNTNYCSSNCPWNLTCTSCLALSYCVYCNGVCLYGYSTGPYYAKGCSLFQYQSCTAVAVDVCQQHSDSCDSCTQSGQSCVFCLASGSCVSGTALGPSNSSIVCPIFYHRSCPSGCGNYSVSCSACINSGYSCVYCNSTASSGVCMPAAQGSCPSTSSFYSSTCSYTSVPCGGRVSCSQCSSDYTCVWCFQSQTCVPGSYSGPYTPSSGCRNWNYYASYCSYALTYPTCQQCATTRGSLYRGFCNGTCMYGSNAGPYFSSCSAWQYKSCSAAPIDSCSAYSSSCSNCISSSSSKSCGYCAATRLCMAGVGDGLQRPPQCSDGGWYTMTCPSLCEAFTTCSSCLAFSSICAFCSSTGQCVTMASPASLPSCTAWNQVSCAATVSPCSTLTSCTTCGSSRYCGWCYSTGVCMEQGLGQPISGTCSWFDVGGTSCNCAPLTNCTACLNAFAGCGYCDGRCMAVTRVANISMPASGAACSSWKFSSCSASAVVDPCTAFIGNCQQCSAKSGCGYCNTTQQCLSGASGGPTNGGGCGSWYFAVCPGAVVSLTVNASLSNTALLLSIASALGLSSTAGLFVASTSSDGGSGKVVKVVFTDPTQATSAISAANGGTIPGVASAAAAGTMQGVPVAGNAPSTSSGAGGVIGGVIGGIVVIGLIIGVVMYLQKQRSANAGTGTAASQSDSTSSHKREEPLLQQDFLYRAEQVVNVAASIEMAMQPSVPQSKLEEVELEL